LELPIDWPLFIIDFKNLGVPDSTGLLIELSWDSINWYNMADSIQVYELFDATGPNIENPFPIPLPNEIDTLIDGRVVFGVCDTCNWNSREFALKTEDYTTELVPQFHVRVTYINYATQLTLGVGIGWYDASAFYTCEPAIHERDGDLDVRLYPNPIDQSSIFELPASTSFPVQLTITDSNGKVIVDESSCRNIIPLQQFNLGEGVYLYRIVDKKGAFSQGKMISESSN
jgi:hypothetical protein